MEQLERLAIQMKYALANDNQSPQANRRSSLAEAGGNKRRNKLQRQHRPKQKQLQAGVGQANGASGGSVGGGGSVTLCQLMNICDSPPLGKDFFQSLQREHNM